jgi:hypothetical protein
MKSKAVKNADARYRDYRLCGLSRPFSRKFFRVLFIIIIMKSKAKNADARYRDYIDCVV